MRKYLNRFVVSVLVTVSVLVPFLSNSVAYALDCKDVPPEGYDECMNLEGNYDSSQSPKAVFDGRDGGECQGFLGLTSWDCGVHISDEASLKNGIWQIVANIATDITVIAAYLVLGYVIYGGYQYIFSAGDPGKLASGKKTITHAFIGLAIVMSADVIMSTIRFALLGASGRFDCNPLQEQKCIGNPSDLVSGAIQWVVGVAGLVAAIFVVYGGIAYVTSAGEPSKIQKAKQIILYALIGLAVVGLAELITAFVSGLLRDAGADGSAFTNTNIIAKEIHDNKIL